MDKLEFMNVVKDVLDECKDKEEIRKRAIQMKMIINDMANLELEYERVGIRYKRE